MRSISCTNKVATLLKGMLNIIMMMKNVEYDFYNLNGEYGHEVLKCMLIIKLSIVTNCI